MRPIINFIVVGGYVCQYTAYMHQQNSMQHTCTLNLLILLYLFKGINRCNSQLSCNKKFLAHTNNYTKTNLFEKALVLPMKN